MMWWGNGAGWGAWVVMTLVMLVFWGLLIYGILAIVRGDADESSARARRPEHEPERILDERFARGEIDEDEYHARKNVLRALQ